MDRAFCIKKLFVKHDGTEEYDVRRHIFGVGRIALSSLFSSPFSQH